MQRGMEKGEKAKPSVHQDRAHSLHSPPSAQHRGRTLMFGLFFFLDCSSGRKINSHQKGRLQKLGLTLH